jgi:hypothetical protein
LGGGTAFGAGEALALVEGTAAAGLGDGFSNASKGETKSNGDLLEANVLLGAGLALDSGTWVTLGEFDPIA